MLSARAVLCVGACVLALSLVATVGGSSAGVTDAGEAQRMPGDGAPSTHDGAVGAAQPTIPGEVTTSPVFAGERVLVGTDRGLAVFADGRLVHHVETQPVRRVVPTGDGTAVVLVENEYFANVRGIDLDSGTVSWAASSTVDVYSPDFGEVQRQARPSDATPVGDISGDGTTDVAVTLGQSVAVFDGASGDTLWKRDHGFNLWTVDSADGTVYAGTQDGKVLALDAASGDTEFERRLVEPFDIERDDVGTPHRSVWSVDHTTVGGASRLVATGEDGSVHLLDAGDGSTVWREQVVEFDGQTLEEYYGRLLNQGRLTLPGDATFSAIDATLVERGDSTDVAVTVAVEQYPRRVGLGSAPQRLLLLDGTSGQQQWVSEDLTLESTGSVAYSPSASALLVPQSPSDATQPVVRFGVESGDRTVMEYPAVPPRDRAVQDASTGFVAADGDRLALVASAGDLRVGTADGTVDWSYPAFRNVGVRSDDFTGDGVDDYLFQSGDASPVTSGAPQSRGLVLRDGANGTLVWSALTDAEGFTTDGGFAAVQSIPDRDGPSDLLAVRSPPPERAADTGATIVIFDGQNGTRAATIQSDQIRFRSAVAFGPVGDRRVVLAAFDRGVSLLDLNEQGEYAGRSYRELPEQDIPQWRPFEGDPPARYLPAGDGDGDGTREVVAVSRQGRVATVSLESPDSLRTVEQADLGGPTRVRTAQPIGDVTGDGYAEIAFQTESDEGQVLAIYAPGQGEVVEWIDQAQPEDIRRVGGNFTGGAPGAVLTRSNTETPAVMLYAGMDRALRHEFDRNGNYRLAGVSSLSPAAPAGDVDGDGSDELAIVEGSTDGGARVNLTDADGSVVDSIELSQFAADDARTMPGLYAQAIPDRTGDGNPELGVVTNVAGTGDLDIRYYVLDPQAGEVLLGGRGRVAEFITAGESGVGVVSPDGSTSVVDPTTGVTITDTAAGTATDLSWEFDGDGGYVTRVYVDGTPVTLTDGTEATVRLPPGEHTIQVRATNARGVTVYDTTTVTVESGSSLDLVLFGATAAAVVLLLVPYGVRRFRRRP